jgi:hypothetical protein
MLRDASRTASYELDQSFEACDMSFMTEGNTLLLPPPFSCGT